MATIIDGRALAKQVNAATEKRVAALAKKGIKPGLASIMVGDDPASKIYTRSKQRRALAMGMNSFMENFPVDTSQETLERAVAELNHNSLVDGILIQQPLPAHLDAVKLTSKIDPAKDVDGFHPQNIGHLYANHDGHYAIACTPLGIMKMLDYYQVPLDGAEVVIVGRSNLVGRPLTALMLNAHATVTMAGTHTRNLAKVVRHGDIVVVATGVPRLITAEMIKPGAVVIDVGINRMKDGSLTGDVDFEGVKEVASKITPVPGGVGPMTIASLMSQTVDLTEWRHGIER